MSNRIPEPCLCGAPDCVRCFPYQEPEPDPDEAYERWRQDQLDDELLNGETHD